MQGNGWSLPLLGAPFTESMTMMRSRHDRPIDNEGQCRHDLKAWLMEKNVRQALTSPNWPRCPQKAYRAFSTMNRISRSEEHTSELQSLMSISYAVFCLNKKKKQT